MTTVEKRQNRFSKAFVYQDKKVPWLRGGRRVW